MDVGQSEIAPLEAIGEFGVFEPEEMEDGGLEIVDVDGIDDRLVPELVGLAQHEAALHPAPASQIVNAWGW